MDKCPSKHDDDLRAASADAERPGTRRFWRSLDEVAGTAEFEQYLHREFPQNASEWTDPVSRRNFLKLMSASLALAGAYGCTRQPEEAIVPYVQPPEQLVPGKPLFFATAFPHDGYGLGVLAESHMGRPIKLEGNPDHPASLGATDYFAQASILGLYDPDRAQVVKNVGNISTWNAFVNAFTSGLDQLRATGGDGLRILSESFTSPTLASQRDALLQQFPNARWHHYEPFGRDNIREGARLAFGREVHTVYRFDQARRILTLDADVLSCGAGNVRYQRDFAQNRRVRIMPGDQPLNLDMNRLYAVESTPTPTGATADHRLRMPATRIELFTRAVLALIQGQGAVEGLSEKETKFLQAVVEDLLAHRGQSVVVAGHFQSPAVHALAHAINDALDAVGQTVFHTDPVEATTGSGLESLAELVRDMQAGRVKMLVILGVNPVFTAPSDLNFLAAMQNVDFRVHHSLYHDETSFQCHWHVPDTHYLEEWGDIRAFDGTTSIIQPLIAPLYRSRSVHELLAAMLGNPAPNGREIVQNYWRTQVNVPDFDTFWRQALEKGVIPNTAFSPIQVALQENIQSQPAPQAAQGIEVIFRPDPTIHDGRYANNGWLQELPKPLTKLTWDNVAHMSAHTAVALGLASQERPLDANGKIVSIKLGDREVRMPAWVMPGHPDDAITVHCGYGRTRIGGVALVSDGVGHGFNVYPLRASGAMLVESGATVTPTGETYRLACTQVHQVLDTEEFEEREIVRVGTIEDFKHQATAPAEEHAGGHRQISLSIYEEWPYGIDGPMRYSNQHAWGMAIDMTACTSCQACVVACQAENNIPVVGKEQVIRGREMHWLRIDTYYEGDPQDPAGPHFQPMLCQHCETAPCEVVCPVAATSHSAEGLNEMTYNRCVGTRYCSNNCPYKVRRFNFLNYGQKDVPVLQLMYNPDVTVRDRGVMEKCTYCVQRINQTRIEIKKLRAEASEWADNQSPEAQERLRARIDLLLGSLQTACQQACPSEAIVFGDLNRGQITGTQSLVRVLREQPHSYGVLNAELNTRPRTTYLSRITNPNPALAPAAAARAVEHDEPAATH